MFARAHALAAMLLASACRPDSSDPPPAYAPQVRDGDAVFFVGNSFLAWEGRDVPSGIAALGEGLSPPVHLRAAGDIVPGEAPLADFLTHPATMAALESRAFDVFVLQGHEFEPVDHREAFHAAVREFDRQIRAAGGSTVLFMTWEFPFRPFIDELAASYEQIGRELAIPVIPVGLVYRDCTREPPRGKSGHWLIADPEHPSGDLHPNALGMAASTYTTFAILTGRNPAESTWTAPGSDLDDTHRRYVSDVAWRHAAPRIAAPP